MSNWRQPARIRRQGRQARHDGLGLGDNPYAKDGVWRGFGADLLAAHWADGWREADDEIRGQETRRFHFE